MPIIICPNCTSGLELVNKSMRCPNGHSFDIAKQGYINLLLANQKKNINPGDNKIMIHARDAFLSKGYFDFLIEGIESMVNSAKYFSTPNTEIPNLLDLGCGTGFYTRNIFKERALNRVGLDISKIGIAKAAVKDKTSTYIVGSVFDLPIADDAVDLLINIFSPIHLEEVKRVLKPGGYVIKIIPKGNHMKEVAELVYDKFNPHQSAISADLEADPKFRIVAAKTLKREITLSEDDLRDFISMTPYLYKFKEGQLEALKEMSVTISFEVIVAELC